MEIRIKQKIDYVLGYGLFGLLLPVTRLLGISLRRDHSIASPPRTIVIIKLLGLGSLLLASDAIAAIRKKYPGARLILLSDSNIAAGIAPFGLFDEIRIVNTANLLLTAADSCRFLIHCWRLRKLWVIDFEVYSKLTTVLALLTLARNRFGFILTPVIFRRRLNTHNIVFDPSGFLEDNFSHMAREVMGGDADSAMVPAPPRSGGDLSKPFIVLNNTCSGLAYVRRLPDSTFSEICQWILDHTVYRVALLGAPGDKEDIDRFIGNHPGLLRQQERILNVAGWVSDFPAYYRFLREEGACLITIDSGPLHIARKLGLPTLSVWGPTDPANYVKVSPAERDRHLTFYGKTSCSPCVHRFQHLPCGGNNFCMKNIPAGALIDKIKELLSHLA